MQKIEKIERMTFDRSGDENAGERLKHETQCDEIPTMEVAVRHFQ